MVQIEHELLVSRIEPIDAAEAEAQSNVVTQELVALLEDLAPDDWNLPTDCERWAVRDVVAHLIGWNEAVTSMREMGKQSMAAALRFGEFGNIVDAQNEVQVEARSSAPPADLIARLHSSGASAAKRRRKIASAIGRMPIYLPFLGGWIKLDYLLNATMPRDILVHRIDVARAASRTLEFSAVDQRITDDIVRDWYTRSDARARLVLKGEMDRTYVSSAAPIATLTSNTVDFIRFLFGREERSVIEVEGDEAAAGRWLDTFFPV